MPTNQENIIDDIKKCAGASLSDQLIARKMFILDPAYVFKDNKLLGFQILNAISEKFRVPLSCVKIAGSAQIGFSCSKNRDFLLGESDLDIAIISPILYQRYCEIVYEITNAYKNLTGFTDQRSADSFRATLHIGFFRPDLMPNSKEKNEWFVFFKSLTDKYSIMFRSVNGGIYFSERFFEGKQLPVIKIIKT